jgi:hypothetical protein
MPRHNFPCGHSGKGRYCHRCKQERDQVVARAADRKRQLDDRRTDKAVWESTFASDPIDLRGLQTRERVIKARELLQRLAAGEPYANLGGKRWESDRCIVAVPIGWGYRLVLRYFDDELRAVACMTHEAYNGLKPGAFREEVRRGR